MTIFDNKLLENIQKGRFVKCPKCNNYYMGTPVISRDNKTKICGSCGRYEALNAKFESEGKDYRFNYNGNIITIRKDK